MFTNTNSSSGSSKLDLFQSGVKKNNPDSSIKHILTSNIHDEVLSQTRIETHQEFISFHKNSKSKGSDFPDNEYDDDYEFLIILHKI